MPSLRDFLPLLMAQSFGTQGLARTPEPCQVTAAADNVVQYDRVMGTKLVIAYAAALETIHRAATATAGSVAIDLACGPGHFTLCLARYLDCHRVTGLDLSGPMIEAAARNAKAQGADERVGFKVGDATDISDLADGSVDLCCCTDAAHHLPDLSIVTEALREMERVTCPDGLILVMDLVRLRTARVTERYVNLLAHDYVARGLPSFFNDFRNSMYAAWTGEELRRAVPVETRRTWCHLIPRGLPTIQFLLGLPAGRQAPFVRPGWATREHPLIREWAPRWEKEVGQRWARETISEFRLLKTSLRFAAQTFLSPAARAAAQPSTA
jgi:ubiquinone/menaquinone biosynthesis C-methylase UbiE